MLDNKKRSSLSILQLYRSLQMKVLRTRTIYYQLNTQSLAYACLHTFLCFLGLQKMPKHKLLDSLHAF